MYLEAEGKKELTRRRACWTCGVPAVAQPRRSPARGCQRPSWGRHWWPV